MTQVNEKTYVESVKIYKILGDETRIRILWLLMDQELCVSDLAIQTKKTASAISHQLRELRMGQLVKVRREGKNLIYTLKNKDTRNMLIKIQEYIEHQLIEGGHKY